MGNYAYTRDEEKSRKSLSKIIIHCAFKRIEKCSLLAGKYYFCKRNALSKGEMFFEKKKTKSFGGKIVLRKKRLCFRMESSTK